MNKDTLLKTLATYGYNVGFGAKKHFATYDLLTKLPYWISFITLSVGVIQLGYPDYNYHKEVSIGLILTGIASLFLNFSNSEKGNYDEVGGELTQIFNSLRALYLKVKDSQSSNFDQEEKEMDELIRKYYSIAITKQVFLSDWYAHLKFFYQMQIEWVNEELKFKFWKDKVPNSLKAFVIIVILIVLIFLTTTLLGNVFPETTNVVTPSKIHLSILFE